MNLIIFYIQRQIGKRKLQSANYLLKQMFNTTWLQVNFQTLVSRLLTYFQIFIYENFDIWFLSTDENLKWESIWRSVLTFQMLSNINVALYIISL